MAGTVRFFRTPAALCAWFAKHHASATELWLGYHKKDTGRPSVTWPESVDEALCVGWIDGVRKTIDEASYKIRFTPRKSTSIWSAVNIRRVALLTAEGRMQAAGLSAFAARRENKSGVYAYEQRPVELGEPYAGLMRANNAAWSFFQAQPAGYRKTLTWWVISAKQGATRLKRLGELIAASAEGRRLD